MSEPIFFFISTSSAFPLLFAGDGQVIFVHGADFGRHDRTTCAYKQPSAHLEDVNCSHPTSKVADRYKPNVSDVIHSTNVRRMYVYEYSGVQKPETMFPFNWTDPSVFALIIVL